MHPDVVSMTVTFLQLMLWTIIARAFMSFLPVDQSSTIYKVLHGLTEPIIEPVRRIMPQTGMIDLSPLFTLLGLIVMMQVVQVLEAD